MWLNPQFPANLVTFTEEILNGKLQFLCSVTNNSACEPLVYNDPTFFVIVVVVALVCQKTLVYLFFVFWLYAVKGWYKTYNCISNMSFNVSYGFTFLFQIESDCNGTWTHNHLVLKPALNHLVKLVSLAKWLSVRLQPKWFQVRVSVLSLSGFSLLPLIQASLNLPPSECIEM